MTLSLYLNARDKALLERTALQNKSSQAGILRKLLHVRKYADTLKTIEKSNQINIYLYKELRKIGVNINQIAKRLNSYDEDLNEVPSSIAMDCKDNLKIEIENILNTIHNYQALILKNMHHDPLSHKTHKNTIKEEDYE